MWRFDEIEEVLGDEVDTTPRIAPGKQSLTSRLFRMPRGVPLDPHAALARTAGSTGAPLPDDARTRFEASLGADLSAVRVHTSADSAAAAADLGARAFATGQDIHFGAGEYRPDDPFGVHLLAHEVAHTVQQGAGAALQTKLEVSEPGDAFEVEADRAADAMVSGALHPIARTTSGDPAQGAEAAVARAAAGSGQALPADLQARFETSLGSGLDRVRVHTGAASAAAAEAVGARAYAVGQDIHFNAGEYDPSSAAGQRLLAHEVAHTVQQAGGAPLRQHKLQVSMPGDALEVEADRAAEAMVQGAPATVGAGGGVARQVMREVKSDTVGNATTIQGMIAKAITANDRARLEKIGQALDATADPAGGAPTVSLDGNQYLVDCADVPMLREMVTNALRDLDKPAAAAKPSEPAAAPAAKPSTPAAAPKASEPDAADAADAADAPAAPSSPASARATDTGRLSGMIQKAAADGDDALLSEIDCALANAAPAENADANGSSGDEVVVDVSSVGAQLHIAASDVPVLRKQITQIRHPEEAAADAAPDADAAPAASGDHAAAGEGDAAPAAPAAAEGADAARLRKLIGELVAAGERDILDEIRAALAAGEASAGEAAAASGVGDVVVQANGESFTIGHADVPALMQLLAPPGPVGQPPGVDLNKLTLTFTIPAGLILAAGETKGREIQTQEFKTTAPTQVTITVSQTGLNLQCNPPLLLWHILARNSEFTSASLDFTSGAITVNTAHPGALPGFSSADVLRDKLAEKIRAAIAGTAISRPPYNPLTDPDLPATLRKIAANVSSGPKNPNTSDVGAKDVTGIEASVNATLTKKGGIQPPNGTGIQIAAGGTFTISGKLAGSAADAAKDPKIQELKLTSSSVKVAKKGEVLILLQEVAMYNGGTVSVINAKLVGSAGDAEGGEGLLRDIAGLLRVASGASPSGDTPFALDPKDVPALAEAELKAQLRAGVTQLIIENRSAVPGVDLAKAMGLDGK